MSLPNDRGLDRVTFSDHIHALRAEIPGCRLVAFGDVQTRLMLKASHGAEVRREKLDQLSEEAAFCFEMSDITDCAGQGRNHVLVLTLEDMRVFVRSAANTSDFLCLVCDLQSDPDILSALGQQALHRLTEVQ